ncbi:Hyoscyamine (6S)-dioxygenase [Bertholletia excelsa]
MENQGSSWFEVEHVPESYVFPPDSRPGKLVNAPLCKTFPVIDLQKSSDQDKTEVIRKILKASEEFGMFQVGKDFCYIELELEIKINQRTNRQKLFKWQVVNHGVSENLMAEAMGIFKEFFHKPAEDKASVINGSGLIYTSSTGYAKDGVHLWRENLKQICHPLETCMQFSPKKLARYREIVEAYVVELKELSRTILELIGQGLGLEPGFFKGISELQLLSANYYPPCPDPSLTLGILKHCDPSFITILLQDVSGLQVVKGQQWVGVEALPNAFLVNIGNQLQIISNGKLKSPEHRAVTNSRQTRTSIATFINPAYGCTIEPAKALVNASNPPNYSSFLYKDFVNSNQAFGIDTAKILKRMSS